MNFAATHNRTKPATAAMKSQKVPSSLTKVCFPHATQWRRDDTASASCPISRVSMISGTRVAHLNGGTVFHVLNSTSTGLERQARQPTHDYLQTQILRGNAPSK
jgi:hypothetical protein